MRCLISHSAEVGLNRHFPAALKHLYGHYKSPAVQVLLIPRATGEQTQRLKLDWLTKEESLLEHSIKSEVSPLEKAPGVLITLREDFPKCCFQVIFHIFQGKCNGAAI